MIIFCLKTNKMTPDHVKSYLQFEMFKYQL